MGVGALKLRSGRITMVSTRRCSGIGTRNGRLLSPGLRRGTKRRGKVPGCAAAVGTLGNRKGARKSKCTAAKSSSNDAGAQVGEGGSGLKEDVVPVVAKMFISPLAFGVACIPLIVSSDRLSVQENTVLPPMLTNSLFFFFTFACQVATAVAYATTGLFHVSTFLVQCISSIFIIVWLNVTNDVFDSETGVDKEKVESVVNRTGDRDALFWVANGLLAIGIALFVGVILQTRQYCAGAMLLAAVSIGYIYQGPPFRLSYKGLGEVLCFFAFGPLATNAFFLIQSGMHVTELLAHPLAIWTSVLLGLTTSNILLNSHYHQVQTDSSTGKLSPAVRFGTRNVSRAVCAVLASVYTIYLACIARGVMPRTTLLVLPFTLPSALKLCRFVVENHANKKVIKPAKFLAVDWHRKFALLLSLGLLLCQRQALIVF